VKAIHFFLCLLLSASTGFTLNNLGATPATTTTASTGLSLGGALAGLGGSLFQSGNTATSGN
jgi:nucleoporin p58/p45